MSVSRKGQFILAGLLLLICLALAAYLLLMPANPSVTDASTTLDNAPAEKGSLLALAPAPDDPPLPKGPQPPTPAPVAPLIVAPAPAQPAPTQPVVPSQPTATPQPARQIIMPPTAVQRQPISPVAPAITATPVQYAQAAPPLGAASPTPLAGTPSFIIPYRIKIPAINLDTYVEQVGIAKDGTMDVPRNIWNTGWFSQGGYAPGEIGNAVIAGHLDAPGSKAVFWDLDKLKPGDRIYLSDQAGRQLVFAVQQLQVYPYDQAPLQDIFGTASEARLNLVTCRGVYDRNTRNYNRRLVVYTHLVG